jgi:hypothetical protein
VEVRPKEVILEPRAQPECISLIDDSADTALLVVIIRRVHHKVELSQQASFAVDCAPFHKAARLHSVGGALELQAGGHWQSEARDHDREVLDPATHVPERAVFIGICQRDFDCLTERYQICLSPEGRASAQSIETATGRNILVRERTMVRTYVIPAGIVRATKQRVAPRTDRFHTLLCGAGAVSQEQWVVH